MALDPSFSSVVLLALNDQGPNTGTTFTDQAVLPNTLTPSGTFQWSTTTPPTGLTSAGYSGTTSGDRLSTPSSLSLRLGYQEFTIEIWYRPTVTTGTQYVFSKLDSAVVTGEWTIFRNGTSLVFYASSNESTWDLASAQTIGTVAAGTWYHIEIDRSGNNWYCFLDGVQGSTFTASGGISQGTQVVVVGATGAGTGWNDARFASARITKGVARHTANFTRPTLPLDTTGGITSNGTGGGNWATGASWTGGVAPVAGDSAIVRQGDTITVAASTTATLGPATLTTCLSVQVGATLIIAGTLNVRGNLLVHSEPGNAHTTSLQLNGGGTLIFDNSTAVNNSYTCALGDAAFPSSAHSIKTSGTSSLSRATVKTGTTSGTGRGSFVEPFNSSLEMNLAYVDFLDLGTAAVDAFKISLPPYLTVAPTLATHRLTNSTWTRCGLVNLFGTFSGHLVYTSNAHNFSQHATTALSLSWADTTGDNAPATRLIQDNGFDAAIDFNFSTSNVMSFDRNYISQIGAGQVFLQPPSGAATSFTKNVCRGITGNENQMLTPFSGLQDLYMISDESGPGNQHFMNVAGGQTFDGCVFEMTATTDNDSDGLLSASGTGTVTAKNCLVLPSAGGTKSCCLLNAGNTNAITHAVTHNTVCVDDGRGGVFMGELFPLPGPGYFTSVKNNLFWKAGGSVGAFYDATVIGSSAATAGSTSTVLNDTAQAWPTAANTTLVNWTLKMTSGVNNGLSRTVASNTATSLTVSVAFPSSIGTGDTYAVYPVDVCVQGQMDYNGMFGIASGTVKDALNANPTSKVGYDNWRVTTIANVGLHDVSGDPSFVDTTRNMATFASVYLGYTNASVDSTSVAKGAWATSTVYAVGDVVSTAIAAHYNSATILYRCTLAHTSAASNKPGDNTVTWHGNWEYYSLYTLRIGVAQAPGAHANATATNLFSWVRAGFQPQTAAYHAASDNISPSNGWIGAVAGPAGPVTPAAIIDPAAGAIARYWEGLPGNRATLTLADQTATSATLAMGTPIRNIKALLYCKTFTAGTGTIGPKWELQVSDNAGFTTNVRTVALNYGPRAVHAVVLQGVVPDNFLASWVKIKVTLSGSDTVAYDVKGDAA